MTTPFATIADVLAHDFVGNYASDAAAFKAIDAFILANRDRPPLVVAALNHVSIFGMGVDPVSTWQECEEYLRDLEAHGAGL